MNQSTFSGELKVRVMRIWYYITVSLVNSHGPICPLFLMSELGILQTNELAR